MCRHSGCIYTGTTLPAVLQTKVYSIPAVLVLPHTRMADLPTAAGKNRLSWAGHIWHIWPCSDLEPPCLGISCLSAASVPGDSNLPHNRYVPEEILYLSSCCSQPQPVLAWTCVITLPASWQGQPRLTGLWGTEFCRTWSDLEDTWRFSPEQEQS